MYHLFKLIGKAIVFEEAVKFFKEKVPLTPKEFYSLSEAYQKRAFTVTGYAHAEVVKAFYAEITKALEDGTTFDRFKRNMRTFLKDNGYKGISHYRADNIYRTNIQTAYQVGHYQQMTNPTVMTLRPYWQYDAVNDDRTRLSHRAMDGRVFRADNPIWDTWYPPNGFRCRCGINTLSERQVKARGLTVETEVPRMVELNGEIVNIHPDPLFTANPAKVTFNPDLKDYPVALKKAYQNQNR